MISHHVLTTLLVLAQEAAKEGAKKAAPGGLEGLFAEHGQLLMLVLMFGAIYFLLIRPMGKRRKEQETLVAGLKKGDEVITNGGILGRVHAVEERLVTMEIADKVRIRILKTQVAGKYNAAATGESDKPATP